MMYDESVYPNPGVFDPERFMGAHSAPHPTSTGAFGFGRRWVAFLPFIFFSTNPILAASALAGFSL